MIDVASPFLEICVESLESAKAAIAGGADRIELCSALSFGGLTPSSGLAEAVVAVARPANVSVRAMVRPRAGGFDYDDDDVRVAIAEATSLLATGVDGLVFGATMGSCLDVPVLQGWIAAVRERAGESAIGLTLHRAVDTLADPVAAVATAIALGFDQVLTSGGQATAMAGAGVIGAMNARAGGRARVVAASGVSVGNLPTLLERIGGRSVHASARIAEDSDGNADIFGFGQKPAYANKAIIVGMRRLLDNANI